jgi:GWxTD domain-containing protein
MKSRIALVALFLITAVWATPAHSLGAPDSVRARRLFTSAQRRLAIGTPEERQVALHELEDATHLAPRDEEIAVALGRLYLDGDMLHRAFDLADRLAAGDSTDARVLLLEGLAWRRRWLANADPVARDRAVLQLARSGRLAPGEFTCWRALVPLLLDAGEPDLAETVAHLAARAAPGNPEATLLVATTSELRGDLAAADLLFQKAILALRPSLRACYSDLSPLLPPWTVEGYRSLHGSARARFEERYWQQNDPDPVSPENEARLEFWARVTEARLLYGEPNDIMWDMRAEYFVRFGRPALAQLNPGDQGVRRGDWLSWVYPELGMRVWMGSPSAFIGFHNAFTATFGWVTPAPESLASHGELQPMPGSWAVFHNVPPGVEPIDARFVSANFESDRGPQILARTEVRGGPEDAYTAEWVVLGPDLAVVHRDLTAFAVSACDPAEAQSASLEVPLRPGHYRVGVRVTDADGRRGVLRRDLEIPHPLPGLALSDLVVTCGGASTNVAPGQGVRLELDTGLEPESGDHLDAYFEIYRLDADAGGEGRFEYECTVRPIVHDRRGWASRMLSPHVSPATLSMSRSEVTQGPIRRQFLSVPLHELLPGHYLLEVRVRDKVSGDEAMCSAPFDREIAAATTPEQ